MDRHNFAWVIVWIAAAMLGMLLGLTLDPPVHAQQKPFVGYTINGGCLYVTPQGFAVIRVWNDTKDELVSQKVCE